MSGHLVVARVADVVNPCPPMFSPSHRGCQFAPSMTESIIALALVLVGVAIAVVALLVRKSDGRQP